MQMLPNLYSENSQYDHYVNFNLQRMFIYGHNTICIISHGALMELSS